MNKGVKSAIEYGMTNLITIGDSRLAIQQSMGVIACRKETLQLKLSQHKGLTAQLKPTRYLHVVRAYNAAADSLATEALESQVTKVVPSESRKPELKALNKIPEGLYVDEQALAETNLPAQRIQTERIRRVRVAQDEERRWADLKAYLRGDVESLSFKRAANASKLADRFGLDKDGLLQYVGKGRKLDEVGEHEPQLRLVIPTNMIDECSFTGYVFAKAMSSTKAQDVAEVFEEYVFRRFGAPTMIRHDRDPRFMSETCKAFAELIQARSRATLSYRPQANGQQERSVKSIVHTVNVYVEDPLQQDWDDIAEKRAHATNNAMDTTRKETPFYLVHGWDAQSTLKAMTSSLRLGDGSLTDAETWRREANRQHEVSLAIAK
ncbi:unnamed protein product [Phytophthora fragariaefolia]|uniref:Unnamed protein product n=1 Tax=Phytophthora fragariaefolia TaxID=1490495 RepID=A0A9W6XT61_9STRA|nr:unnamed protein product [Phytophthora fragariaefolia]